MSFKNVLLVNRIVPDFQVFLDSVNESTCAIAYSSSTTKVELLELIQQKTISTERIAVVSRKDDLFVESMQIPDCEEFFSQMIQSYGVKNLDFLACNTLMDARWKEFFTRLDPVVVVGASDDLTGNLKYGGDWVMENTNEDIEQIYFKNTIQYYKYLLDFNDEYEIIVKEDGLLYGMGRNLEGQLGISGSFIHTFTQITMNGNPISGVTKVSCGESNTLFIKSGFLYGMGYNYFNQLGIPGTITTPTQITLNGNPISGVTDVAGGGGHTVFVKDGFLYGMGWNDRNQLGSPAERIITTPTQITLNGTPISGVTDVACGIEHTVFVKDGTLYGLGRNLEGQLGIPGTIITPTQITLNGNPISGVTQIACGNHNTVFVKDGFLYGMGDNGFSQLGITGTITTPTQITLNGNPISDVTQIACGTRHTLFVKDGILYGMGNNYFGALGIKDTINILIRKLPLDGISTSNVDISGVTQISCAKYSSSFLKGNVLYGSGSFYNQPAPVGSGPYSFTTYTFNQLPGFKLIENNVSFFRSSIDFITNVPIKSTICFPSGTIKTDQGFVKTTDLKPKIHTINGHTITTITEIYNSLNETENVLVFLTKESYLD